MTNFRQTPPVMRVLCAAIFLVPSVFASVNVKINASSTYVSVGTPVQLTAAATDTANSSATFSYQFQVETPGASSLTLLKDYYYTNSFSWAPTFSEGSYAVQVNVRSSSGGWAYARQWITVVSRVTGSTPVVSPTQNPLVALYSAPACTAPSQVHVRFKRPTDAQWQQTPLQTCDGLSLNFFLGGMTASTTYQVQQDLFGTSTTTTGPMLAFTTGSIPSNIKIPTMATLTGPTPPTAASFPFVLQMPLDYPYASDLYGNVVWYLAAYSNPREQAGLVRNTNAGTFLGFQDDPNDTCPGTNAYCGDHQFVREFDMAGNVVRETNATVLNLEVNALRANAGLSAVALSWPSHDASRLPNGYTAIIITDQEVKDQGQGNVLVDGDCILVLDENFQAVWFWDSFDNLDITRKALQNETCSPGQGGCAFPRIKQVNGQYYSIANDWTHCNAVTLDPKDGNLIVSSRHQSWIFKIAYQNGSGDGHIMWRLGNEGDFQLPAGSYSTAWFNYQHDAQFQSNGILTLFDNNNLGFVATKANSRGQGWRLDETNLIATPMINVDLGVPSLAVGYASALWNGNYDFGAGFLISGTAARTFEYTTTGTLVYSQSAGTFSYRPMRLPDMYTQR